MIQKVLNKPLRNYPKEKLHEYSINAKKQGWFDEVNLIIWGATATLAVDNPTIKQLVLKVSKV